MITPEQIAQIVATVVAMVAQPAETATQAVVSVANKAQVLWPDSKRMTPAHIRSKVHANRVNRGGQIPNGVTCKELYHAKVIDIDGNYIADAMAPTATKTTVTQIAPADKQLMRLTKAELVAKLLA